MSVDKSQGERCGVPMVMTTLSGALFCNAPKGHSGDCSHTFPWTVPSAPAPTATASSEKPHDLAEKIREWRPG